MEPLPTARQMMTWLSMCPTDESSNARQKMAYVAYTLAVLFINLFGFVVCLTYCLKYITSDFNGAVFGFMIAIGELGLTYILFTAISMRHQIGNIFKSLSTIYNCSGNEVTFRYLAEANNISEWVWSFYLKYIAASLFAMATTSLLSVLYCYLTRGNFDIDHFYRPAKLVYGILPWDQTTYAGYFAEVFISLPLTYGYIIVNGTPFLLFISLCLHHQAFSKIFKHSTEKSEKCNAKILCELIRFHISAKDLFSESANVYSPFVLVQLISNTVIMTISVFFLDLQSQQFDLIVATVLVAASVGMSTLLLYCYFGKLASESHETMSDCVFDMNWYEQKIELQKYFILMIAYMQKPVYYHGFEVAKLDLGTFIKLCRSVISYYMAIKTLAIK